MVRKLRLGNKVTGKSKINLIKKAILYKSIFPNTNRIRRKLIKYVLNRLFNFNQMPTSLNSKMCLIISMQK